MSFGKMKIMMIAVIMMISLLPSVFAQEQQQQGWQTFIDPTLGIKLIYPENLMKVVDSAGRSYEIIIDIPDENPLTQFTVNIKRDTSGGTITPQDIVDGYLEILGPALADFRVLERSSTSIVVAGVPAEKLVYTFFTDSVAGEKVHVYHTSTYIVAIKDGNIYQFDYTVYSSDYDRLLPTFEKMLQSVVIE
jgi:hypothetical protein